VRASGGPLSAVTRRCAQQSASGAARPIFGDRALKRRPVKIRPKDRHEYQLAVGGLPEQKIRQTLFPAGADHQVGVGQVGRIEATRQQILSNLRGTQPTGRNVLSEPAHRAHNLLAGAVVERDHEHEAGIGAGEAFSFFEEARDIVVESFPFANDPHTYVAAVEIGEIVADEAPQQRHQVENFGTRT
jgi:hypothetical protein